LSIGPRFIWHFLLKMSSEMSSVSGGNSSWITLYMWSYYYNTLNFYLSLSVHLNRDWESFVFFMSLQREKWKTTTSYPWLKNFCYSAERRSFTWFCGWMTDAVYDEFKSNKHFSLPKIEARIKICDGNYISTPTKTMNQLHALYII
jgi:hypothetical protein